MEKKEQNRIDENTMGKIQNLQLLEQNIQNLMMQKQAFNFEAAETVNALSELKYSKGEVFKIVGSIMIKSEKKDMEKDLSKKKDLIELRIKNIDKQEESLKQKLLEMKEEIVNKIS